MRFLTAVSLLALALSGRPALAQKKAEPAAATAAAPEDELATNAGWNSDWAMLFSLNNVLVQGSILSNFQNLGTAATVYLSPTLALRGGVSLSRSSNPESVTRTEIVTAGEQVVSYTFSAPGTTSAFSTAVQADLIKRLSTGRVAPYVGGGVSLGLGQSRLGYTDNVSVADQTVTINNATTSLTVGARGIAGAEWRFHSNFAVFAEYQLSLSVFTWSQLDNETVVENTTGGVRTATKTSQQRSVPTWLTGSAGLNQGGTLGLLVFF